MPTLDEISLRGMRFHTRIGVLPHEAELPQPLEIDLTVRRPQANVKPGTVLDYRSLYNMVADIVDGRHLQYLEDVAEAVAGAALAAEGVASVRVAVRKPHVALPGPLTHAEVAIERERRG